MRFFTLENLDLDSAEFQEVKDGYWSFVYSIRQQIPLSLYQLHRDYSLHDSEICAVTTLRGGRDLGITIDGLC